MIYSVDRNSAATGTLNGSVIIEMSEPFGADWSSESDCKFHLVLDSENIFNMKLLITTALFTITALAEIVGCYLPYLWLREGKSSWLLLPAALSLGLFAWLLTLHPTAAGRVYAAYGGVYITVAILWLWVVDGVRPNRWDLLGVAVCLVGMSIIMLSPKT